MEKNRYSDAELSEFKALITEKINIAKAQLNSYQAQMKSTSQNDEKMISLDDGSITLEKESLNLYASRVLKLIQNLEKALIRIENKTYGICRETGVLIPKARLMLVPHATLSIEAKNAQK